MTQVIAAAHRYSQIGWRVIPVDHGKKAVLRKGWQQERWEPEQFDQVFGPGLSNIGILTGEPSGGLIDIDLDHPYAVELAPKYLPATPAKFGHQSKPNSHWFYHGSDCLPSKRHHVVIDSKKHTTVEFRSTGGQTIAPPSKHEGTGEDIVWDCEGALPAEVESSELFKAVEALHAAVKRKVNLGDSIPEQVDTCADDENADTLPDLDTTKEDETGVTKERAIELCRRRMLAVRPYASKDGSHRLFTYCCRAVEHDLSLDETLKLLSEVLTHKPLPKAWSNDQIAKRYEAAEARCQRGIALRTGSGRKKPFLRKDDKTGKLILSTRRTLDTAEGFLEERYVYEDELSLVYYLDEWYRWERNCYVPVEHVALQHQMHMFLHNALIDGAKSSPTPIAFPANPRTVASAIQTLQGLAHIKARPETTFWLDQDYAPYPPHELLACRSHIYHVPTGKILPHSPKLFNTHAFDIDLKDTMPSPDGWLSFLDQVLPHDPDSIGLLQEWMGYCLLPDTSQQKMLLLYGQPRSGKGTIARVLQNMLGHHHVAGPTVASLATTFGLEQLINKRLAVISDARFQACPTALVELLLTLSGEDAISINRKFKTPLLCTLPTRFMFLSNEIPRFSETSGALANRFLTVEFRQSFLHREDPGLTKKLLEELPSILHWSLAGRRRLMHRGRFEQTASSQESLQEMELLSSPIKSFVMECCDLDPSFRVDRDLLYQRYRIWCENAGIKGVQTRPVFLRDLSTAFNTVRRRRGSNDPFYEGICLRPLDH